MNSEKPLLAAGYSPALQKLLNKSTRLPLEAVEFGLYTGLPTIEKQFT